MPTSTQNIVPPSSGWFGQPAPTSPSYEFSSGLGGTSGGAPQAGAGVDSNVLTMNLGGTTLNYDLGANTDTLAESAYSYLGNSFNADSNLLGNTIAGGQNFLSSFAAPLENFNTQVLPTMFGTLSNQNYQLGTQAVNAESNVAEASIASSQASAREASSGGGCFITTATCEVTGEGDDGPTLTALRLFRDRYMLGTPARRRLVALYYQEAPKMVAQIDAHPQRRELLETLAHVYIRAAREAIEAGEDAKAFVIYVKALCDLRAVLPR